MSYYGLWGWGMGAFRVVRVVVAWRRDEGAIRWYFWQTNGGGHLPKVASGLFPKLLPLAQCPLTPPLTAPPIQATRSNEARTPVYHPQQQASLTTKHARSEPLHG